MTIAGRAHPSHREPKAMHERTEAERTPRIATARGTGPALIALIWPNSREFGRPVSDDIRYPPTPEEQVG